MQFSRPLAKSRRYSTGCQSVWNSRLSRAIRSGSIGIYFTFPNSKDIIPRSNQLSNDAMCERPFPDFHTSDFCGQEPVTGGESRPAARPWREINRQHVRTFEIPRMFQTARASLYLDPSPNYGYSAEWSGPFSSRESSVCGTQALAATIPNHYLMRSLNATLMLPPASSLFDALWDFKLFSLIDAHLWTWFSATIDAPLCFTNSSMLCEIFLHFRFATWKERFCRKSEKFN